MREELNIFQKLIKFSQCSGVGQYDSFAIHISPNLLSLTSLKRGPNYGHLVHVSRTTTNFFFNFFLQRVRADCRILSKPIFKIISNGLNPQVLESPVFATKFYCSFHVLLNPYLSTWVFRQTRISVHPILYVCMHLRLICIDYRLVCVFSVFPIFLIL